jgi:hypothetical protein
MTDTELRNLQADLVALKRTASFFFGLIAVAAVGYAAYWSWYAMPAAAVAAFVYGRSLDDILWPERVTQRAGRRKARRQARVERLEARRRARYERLEARFYARQAARQAFEARHAKLFGWLAWGVFGSIFALFVVGCIVSAVSVHH